MMVEVTGGLHDSSENGAGQNGDAVRTNNNPANRSQIGRTGDVETMQLRTTFPEEIWLMIFETLLTDADAPANLSKSSPYFCQLLEKSRVYFLFQHVFPFIELRKHVDYDSINAWISTMLKLRLVCKPWSQVIDKFLDKICSGQEGNSFKLQRNFFEIDPSRLYNFHQHFQHTHSNTDRNPILGREVTFRSVPYTGANAAYLSGLYLSNITNFLRVYGKHIHNCTFSIDNKFLQTRTAYYLKLKEWLEHLPSLNVLDVRYQQVNMQFVPLGPMSYYNGDVRSSKHTLEELTELEAEINLNPVPKIPSLQCISTSNLPPPILKHIVTQNSHLSKLATFRTEKVEMCYDICVISLPNLSELSLRFSDWSDLDNFDSFNVNWPVTKITLDFCDCPWVHWCRILGLLQNKWGKTVTDVTIKFPEAKSEQHTDIILKQTASARLDLPKIQNLKLRTRNICSFDFILPMKDTLKSLDICLEYGVDGRWNKNTFVKSVQEEQIIKYLDDTDLLLWSNIWKLFPKLQRLSVAEAHVREMLNFADGRSVPFRWNYRVKCHTRMDWIDMRYCYKLGREALRLCS